MSQVDIDVVSLQARQAVFDFAHDVKARESGIVGPISRRTAYLGSQYDLVSPSLEGPAEDALAAASLALIGAVDEIDAHIDGAVDCCVIDIFVLGTAKGGAQDDRGDLDPCRTEIR